jgi:autotransporter-associated beta strand protein
MKSMKKLLSPNFKTLDSCEAMLQATSSSSRKFSLTFSLSLIAMLMLAGGVWGQNANVQISNAASGVTNGAWTTSGTGATLLYTFTPSANNAVVSNGDIQNRLLGSGVTAGSVRIITTCASCDQTGDVTQAASATITAATASANQWTFTITASGSITISQAITSWGASTSSIAYRGFNVTLTSGTTGSVTVSAAINTTGSTGGSGGSTQQGGAGGNISITSGSTSGSVLITSDLTTSGGTTTKNNTAGAAAGTISFANGIGGIRCTGNLTASGSAGVGSGTTGSGGNIAIACGNSTITTGGGVNDGVSGIISNNGGTNGTVTKNGTGTLVLSGANTYNGSTSISAGVLNIQNATGLGTTTGGTTVSSGAALQLQGAAVGAEALTLNGTGVSTDGALRFISGTNSWGGLITLGSNSRINADAGTNTLDVASGSAITGTFALTIGGAGNLTIADPIATGTATLTKDGAGTLIFSGANTYTGATRVNEGVLQISAAERIANTSNLILDGGTFSTGSGTGFTETIGTLQILSNSTLQLGTGNHSLIFAASNAVSWTATRTLTITGWTGAGSATGTAGKVFFGSANTGLTSTQLGVTSFTGYSTAALMLSSGECVPTLPAPTISSISPSSLCSAGGQTVTITGSAFTGATSVTFNGEAAASFSVTSSTTISAVTPSGITAGAVTVTTSGGSANSSNYSVNLSATADAGPALTGINQGQTSAQMGGSVGGSATGGTWSGGAGTWTNASNPTTATYTASANESGTITLTLTTSGNDCGTTVSKNIEVSITPATFPYTENFNTYNPFTFVNGVQTNKWAYGSATGNTGNSIYISNDNGTTNTYTITSTSVVQAYRDIVVPQGASTANFSFDWRANGESTFDYFRVWLVPNTFEPVPGTQITAATGRVQVGTNFGLQTTWQSYSNAALNVSTFASSTMRLVFEWRNDASAGTQPPVAIDNISLSFPAPTISSFTPSSGCPGATVTINGTNFSGATAVKFNSVDAVSYNVISASQITAVLPFTTSGTISVTGLGGSVTSSSSFSISNAPPTPTVSVTGSSTINVGGTSSLVASGTGGTLNWYTQASGGTSFFTGSSYDLPTQCASGTTTYFVEEVGEGSCNSIRGSVAVTVRPVIASNPTNALICSSGSSVALSTQLTGASGITWSPNTNLSTTSGASTVASPTLTTQYTVTAIVSGCIDPISATQNVGVIEGVSFTPSANPTSVCAGSTSDLSANLNSSNFSVLGISYAAATEPNSGVTTIANAGVAVVPLSGGTLDDGGWAGIPIGFTFNYFGNNYNTIAAGTNGVLMFGTVPGYTTAAGNLGQYSYSSNASNCSPAGASSGQVFPNCNNPANIIALMANDLELKAGSIKYWIDGIAPTRRFIIQYTDVPHYAMGGGVSSSRVSAQCILYETTGVVEIHVLSAAAGTGSNAKTIGLQNASKTIGATAPGRQAFTTAITTPEAWRFIPGVNYSFQWSTVGSNIEGATNNTYTTSALNTPGTVTYTVAATNPNTQCASTANVSLTVNARPAAPVSLGNVTACNTAGSQNLSVSVGVGETAAWYSASTAGTLLTNNNTTHQTSTAGTYHAEARNTTTNCTSASRTPVTLTINNAPSAPTASPVTYCQGATASPMTASAPAGSNTQKWYEVAVDGTPLGSAPTPSTATATTLTYYVSEVSGTNGCESSRTSVSATINATPLAPATSNPSAYCQNASASPLTATASGGNTLYWFTVPTGGTGSTTAITPSTSSAGTTDYYVSQRTASNCESPRATITVTVNPSITASVTNSASSTSACGGGSITFTATPTNGGSPSYQWKRNNTNVGSNSNTYTLSTPVSGDEIYVVMTPSAQTCLTSTNPVNSNTVTLTSTAATPSVTIKSSALTAICPGTSVTFSVNSSANMGASPTYQWKLNGTDISGATNATLVTTTLANNDQVSLTMTSSLATECVTESNATSSSITTTVNTATSITSQPQATSVCASTNANFSVVGAGQGTLTYQWKKNGSNITGNATSTSSTLTLSGVAAGDVANYTVDVTGSCGTVTSSSAALSLNTATSISAQPAAVTQCSGTTANFSVTAAGQGTITYQWRKDGSSLSSETNSSLSLSNIASSNAGQYSVIVTGGCGSVTSSNALLTVQPATVIATQPTASTVCQNNTANFSVSATGQGTLSYQWKRDGTDVGTNSSSLSVSNAQSSNAGSYTVDVTGGCGTVTSNAVTLTVNPATSITTQPTASAGCEGQNTTFTVVATGTAPLTYQWKFGGVNISGATASTYNILSTTNANDGSYFVTVSGGCGTVNSSAVDLSVYPTPTVNAGSDITVCAGAPITLTGSGLSSGTYTWNNSVQNGVQFNAPISTTTYTLTGTSPQNCSNTDQITVTVRPLFTAGEISSTGQNICTNSDASLIGNVINASGGDQNITYSWRSSVDNFSAAIDGATNATLDPPVLTNTTTYRRYANDGTCNTTPAQSTGEWVVNVNQTSVGGTASAATSPICSGSSTTVSVSGSTGTIQWEQSADGSSGWANVTGGSGGTTSTYTTPSLTSTTYYRAIVTSGACSSDTTSAVAINIGSSTTAGAITGSTSVCSGTNSTELTLTGSIGTIKWQNSTDNVTFTDISGATASTYLATNLNVTSYYRAVVTSGTCSSDTTSSFSITVNQAPTASAGGSINSFVGNFETVSGASASNGTIQWTENGAGYFDEEWFPVGNPTTLTPTYYIKSGDFGQAVTLTMTVTGEGSCSSRTAIATFTINVSGEPGLWKYQCGTTTPYIDEYIYLYAVPLATSYRIKIDDINDTVNPPLIREQSSTVFFFRQFAGAKYNTTYDCSVQALVGGVWSDYGPTCQITTPDVPLTKVANSQCGITLATINTTIFANTVWGVNLYEFSVYNTLSSQTQIFQTTNRYFNLTQLNNYSFSTTYQIKVRTRYVDQWTDFGDVCNVTTPSEITQIETAFCGTTQSSYENDIFCNSVFGATIYEFRLVNGGTTLTIQKSSRTFKFSQVNGINQNTTYSISVRTSTNGIWSAFGTACSLTTPNLLSQIETTYCGTTLLNTNVDIYSTFIPNTTIYEYRLVNGATTLTVQKTSRTFKFSQITGLLAGLTYAVSVRTFTNGSWTEFGPSCNIINPIPTSLIDPQNCETTLANNNVDIYCAEIPNTTIYEFRLVNGGTTLTIQKSSRTFKFSQVTGSLPGVTYSVSVRTFTNGNWSNFGDACNITSASAASKIIASQCGSSITTMETDIYADAVLGATTYRFRISNSGGTTTIDKASRTFKMSQISNPRYGEENTIDVDVLVNGDWIGYDATCKITTPNLPNTKLINSQCNIELSSLTTLLYADPIYGASNYQFRVRNTSLSFNKTLITTGRLFRMSQIAGLTVNTTYDVDVAVFIDGGWKNYGTICKVKTPSTLTMPTFDDVSEKETEELSMNENYANIVENSNEDDFNISAFPNPFDNEFVLKISTKNKDLVEIFMYDSKGKILENVEYNFSNELIFGKNYESGVYFLKITQNHKTKNLKIIKK